MGLVVFRHLRRNRAWFSRGQSARCICTCERREVRGRCGPGRHNACLREEHQRHQEDAHNRHERKGQHCP